MFDGFRWLGALLIVLLTLKGVVMVNSVAEGIAISMLAFVITGYYVFDAWLMHLTESQERETSAKKLENPMLAEMRLQDAEKTLEDLKSKMDALTLQNGFKI